MPCIPFNIDGISGIVCTRGQRRTGKCATCGEKGPGLECDKCDAKLCFGCSVSPAQGIDFCPSCFKPAWQWWLGTDGQSWVEAPKAVRRVAFRKWVREHITRFYELIEFIRREGP